MKIPEFTDDDLAAYLRWEEKNLLKEIDGEPDFLCWVRNDADAPPKPLDEIKALARSVWIQATLRERLLQTEKSSEPKTTELNVGETWYVRYKDATVLSEVKVLDVTPLTVLLEQGRYGLNVRYLKSDATFVELSTETKGI